jgi:flagellar assembly protein FliH
MSLSKYYKHSPSFKAEELVKTGDRNAEGWVPSPTPQPSPFTSRQLSDEARPADKARRPPPAAPAQGPPPGPPPPQADKAPPEPPPPAAKPAVDLTRYIERVESDKRAEEAYRRGIAEGQALAEKEFGTATAALMQACSQLDDLRATLIANSGGELLEFALTVAERVLRLSLREQDHTLVATIEEALHLAVKSDEYTIHINPDDYEILNARAVDIIASISGLNNIVIKKDATIEKGGVSIESDNCTIDATIAGQLELIREEIRKRQ